MNHITHLDAKQFLQEIKNLKFSQAYSIKESTKISDVIKVMQEKKVGSFLVNSDDNKHLTGIVTERDFLFKTYQKGVFQDLEVSNIMTPNPKALCLHETLKDAMLMMTIGEFRHLPLKTEEKAPLSEYIISSKDILKFIIDFFNVELQTIGTITSWNKNYNEIHDEVFYELYHTGKDHSINTSILYSPLRNILPKNIITVDVKDSIAKVINKMIDLKESTVLVTKFGTKILGIVTERDFLLKVYGKIDLNENITKIMTPDPHVFLPRHLVGHAINNMFTYNYRNIILVNEDKLPIKRLSQQKILAHITKRLYEKEIGERTDIYKKYA